MLLHGIFEHLFVLETYIDGTVISLLLLVLLGKVIVIIIIGGAGDERILVIELGELAELLLTGEI